MLSRQIAQKLRGYETPFYLYDTALLRQTLESVVYESKKYGYKVHYAIKANYDDHLLAIIREYGLGIDCASGNELRKAVEAGFDPKGIVYAGVGKRDKEDFATPSDRRSWRSTANRSRSWNSWTGLRARPARRPTWRCASTPTSTPRPITASIPVRPTVSSGFHMKKCLSMPRRSSRSSISIS